MSKAEYSIGIDLGTTNCALAFAPLEAKEVSSIVQPVEQWDSATTLVESETLPSFLYLPAGDDAAQLRGKAGGGDWIVGRFARSQTVVRPGRVVQSAKSWLSSSGVDRTAGFLPWGSDQVDEAQKISPLRASALLLNYFRDAWNQTHAGAPFDEQNITVTVPASFDAAAQRLTLDAAREAGFPEGVRLLEEPQAAFYRWLEAHETSGTLPEILPELGDRPHSILVVDIGGGTSDFSLFDIRMWKNRKLPQIKRVAVSDHILLGGDNIDLALAHAAEPRLTEEGTALSPDQWSHLVAQCRQVKEQALAANDSAEKTYKIAVPGRGSGLLAGTLTTELGSGEIEAILLDGFYPECEAKARPERAATGLRELGLPYAADSAVTRHLAEFLDDRPAVDAVLFNGGSLKPERIRTRIAKLIGIWQGGEKAPVILENPEPDLAVARGAAGYGWLLEHQSARIQAGAPRSLYLRVQKGGESSFVCILPKGTPQEEAVVVDDLNLELRVNQPVEFQVFSNARPDKHRAGEVLEEEPDQFHALPPLQTVARVEAGGEERIPVNLSAKVNAVGLLQVECVHQSAPGQRWPLEFNLHRDGPAPVSMTLSDPGVGEEKLRAARDQMEHLFGQLWSEGDKLSSARLFASLEKILDLPKQDWNAFLLRTLWETHAECFEWRYQSADHEESWINFAGFLLRPGYGVQLDELRIDQLWLLREEEYWFPGKRIDLQAHILWRRVSGGLSRERQEELIDECLPQIRERKKPSAELVRLAGVLERLPAGRKREVMRAILAKGMELADEGGYAEPCWDALTTLLNRAPIYAGAETVLPPDAVEEAFEEVKERDWTQPEYGALTAAFLRAARRVDNRALDLPGKLRNAVVAKLRQADVSGARLQPLERFVAVERSEQVKLYGESLPPGLVLE